jgi:DNA-binding NarL/FixJ family response regulator
MLDDGDAFSVIDELRASAPRVASVSVTDFDPPYLRAEATAHDADGYFTRDTDGDVLVKGLVAAVDRAMAR